MNWCTWWVMFYLCFLFVFRIVSILVEGDVLRRVLCSQSLGFLEFFGRFVDFVGDGGGEVAWIYSYRSSKNSDKGGEGVQNPENFADVLYVWSLDLMIL